MKFLNRVKTLGSKYADNPVTRQDIEEQNFVSSPEKEYSIQIDGQDGEGIINFKTQ